MSLWDMASDDLSLILADTAGHGMPAVHTPHDPLGSTTELRVIIVSRGREAEAGSFKLSGMAYFSGAELASPQYMDTLTFEDGSIWTLMKDAGSMGDILVWEAARDLRPTLKR